MDLEMEAEVTLAKCFAVIGYPLVACVTMCYSEAPQGDVWKTAGDIEKL